MPSFVAGRSNAGFLASITGCVTSLRAIWPASTSSPVRAIVSKYIVSPPISTSMNELSVSKPRAVSAVVPMLPRRRRADPPAMK